MERRRKVEEEKRKVGKRQRSIIGSTSFWKTARRGWRCYEQFTAESWTGKMSWLPTKRQHMWGIFMDKFALIHMQKVIMLSYISQVCLWKSVYKILTGIDNLLNIILVFKSIPQNSSDNGNKVYRSIFIFPCTQIPLVPALPRLLAFHGERNKCRGVL